MSGASEPELFRNRPDGRSVADGINETLKRATEGDEAWVATAYFNSGGFAQLATQLEALSGTRLLLGADPQPPAGRSLAIRSATPGNEKARIKTALEGQARTIALDRDLLGFTEKQEVTLRRLVAWLRSGKVEVKRFEERFMHGKAFILPADDNAVVAGSSNLTYSGLCRNEELGLGVFDAAPVGEAAEWFSELWDGAVEFDLAAIYEARYAEYEPWLIWLKILWERYGVELADEAGAGQIHLAKFQADGVARAMRMLNDNHGVLVADGVGLGKTFIAGAILEEYIRNRRQRALVIAPAALRDGPWRSFLSKNQISVECISFEQLAADPKLADGQPGKVALDYEIDDYSLVIVDEAHALRNPDALRSRAMRRLLAGSPPKDVVLMTATPVNNSLNDLYEILSLFIKDDARFAPSIPSLRDEIRAAEAIDPEDLTADRLFDVIDAVAVRRTRRLVRDHYPNDTIEIRGVQRQLRFPDPKVLRISDYTLDSALPGVFEQLEHALGCEWSECKHEEPVASRHALNLARYTPSRFLISGREDAYEAQLAGLLRSGLLKRFESSVHAFGLTCGRMAESHDAFLQAMGDGRVMTGRDLSDWIATDNEDLDDWLRNQGAGAGVDAELYDVDALRTVVEADRDILREFAHRAGDVKPNDDPKLEMLVDQLVEILAGAPDGAIDDAAERDRRKVIVFTYYADTVDWITSFLEELLENDPRLEPYRDRLVSLSGSGGSKEDVLFGFAPISSDAPAGNDEDRYDLLISTDVLAEGVNLQQARNIINFDLPWNPMRLVQRHGRIDRIGSDHKTVDIRCFLDDKLDEYLELEARLHMKLAKAAASIGVEDEILPGSKTSELNFSDTREEIDNLEELLETGGERGNALSPEEYRQELRSALDGNEPLRETVEHLAWGSGSGFESDEVGEGEGPVFVFLARVGDRPETLMRMVRMGDDLADEDRIERSTLPAMSMARVAEGTPRVMSEQTHHLAYAAWELARVDIHEVWLEQSDPRSSANKIPKALREAAELVDRTTPPGTTREDADRIAASLRGVYRERVVGVVRAVMNDDLADPEKAAALAAIVEEMGLEPAPSFAPLPEIDGEDVHLVCWQAVVRPG